MVLGDFQVVSGNFSGGSTGGFTGGFTGGSTGGFGVFTGGFAGVYTGGFGVFTGGLTGVDTGRFGVFTGTLALFSLVRSSVFDRTCPMSSKEFNGESSKMGSTGELPVIASLAEEVEGLVVRSAKDGFSTIPSPVIGDCAFKAAAVSA